MNFEDDQGTFCDLEFENQIVKLNYMEPTVYILYNQFMNRNSIPENYGAAQEGGERQTQQKNTL